MPAYNEPADMLIETLDALARLDYPDFEVLVIDNNTRDENVWRPVEAHCAQLGPRFRFFHVAPLAGFKAGALNYALERTAADAMIVAVIDSDYVVEPRWLRDLTPVFEDQRVAIMQGPQDYRDADHSAFKAMCYAEYRGFFHIGMITRNERNAIIQHGTMTMVRRAQLDAARWAEWCITEDAELGLRIFESGFDASYVATSYGRGLMPDTFIDFKKQRFRWAYGAMQIIKAPRARAVPRGRPAVGRTALPLRRRLAAVGGGRLQHAVQPRRPRLVRRHDLGAAADRSAAGDVLGAAAVAVHLQAREARAPVPGARGRQLPADRWRRRSRDSPSRTPSARRR